jgi:hypothetical protein
LVNGFPDVFKNYGARCHKSNVTSEARKINEKASGFCRDISGISAGVNPDHHFLKGFSQQFEIKTPCSWAGSAE